MTIKIWSSPVSWVCPHRDILSCGGGRWGWWEPGGSVPSYCARAVLWMWGVRSAARVSVSGAARTGTVQCARASLAVLSPPGE